MRRGLLLGMTIALAMTLPALAANIADYPDSIIIGDVAVAPGQSQALVPVYFVTYEDVTHYNLPLEVQSAGDVRFLGFVLGQALLGWDDNWQGLTNDHLQALHLGFCDLGGGSNPPLNTGGRRVEAFRLSISIDQQSIAGVAAVAARVDRRTGPVTFGLRDGVHAKTPVVVPGNVTLQGAGKVPPVPLPTETYLGQNYPNPFNPTTEIEFALQTTQPMRLTVYNVLGQEVRTLVSGVRETGYHRVTWDGRNNDGAEVPSGAYFYRLDTADFSRSMKMVLLK